MAVSPESAIKIEASAVDGLQDRVDSGPALVTVLRNGSQIVSSIGAVFLLDCGSAALDTLFIRIGRLQSLGDFSVLVLDSGRLEKRRLNSGLEIHVENVQKI